MNARGHSESSSSNSELQPTVFGVERSVLVYGKRLSYLETNPKSQDKVVMLHGWLDNAASFAQLAPRLGAHCIALDSFGHGLSDHVSSGTRFYNMMDLVYDLIAVLEILDLRDVCLVGHSMGAGISAVAAAVAPERIRRLVLFDGLAPFPEDGKLVQRSQDVLESLAKEASRSLEHRRVASFEAAVLKRLAASPMPRALAEAICARGVVKEGDSWRWRWDPRLLRGSPLRISFEQACLLLKAVQCQTVLVRAIGSPESSISKLIEMYLPHLPGIQVIDVEGGHYVHAEHPELCVGAIQR